MHQDCWLLHTLKNHRQLLYLDPFFGVQTPIKPKIRIPLTKDNKMYAKVAVFIATGHSRRFLIGNVESQIPGMVGTDLSSALLPLVWQLILIIMIDELFLAARRSTQRRGRSKELLLYVFNTDWILIGWTKQTRHSNVFPKHLFSNDFLLISRILHMDFDATFSCILNVGGHIGWKDLYSCHTGWMLHHSINVSKLPAWQQDQSESWNGDA